MRRTDVKEAIIRTLVPIIVGGAGGYAGAYLGWTQETTTAVTTALVAGLYYLAALLLQKVWPGAGILLGSTAQPTYVRKGRTDRRDDTGRGTVAVIVTVLTGVLALLAVPLTVVSTAHAGPERVVPFVQVLAAERCGDVLTVRHTSHLPYTVGQAPDPETATDDADHLFTGGTDARWAWTLLKPSGPVTVEVYSAGRWTPVAPLAYTHQVEREATINIGLAGSGVPSRVRVVAMFPSVGRVASPGAFVTDCSAVTK